MTHLEKSGNPAVSYQLARSLKNTYITALSKAFIRKENAAFKSLIYTISFIGGAVLAAAGFAAPLRHGYSPVAWTAAIFIVFSILLAIRSLFTHLNYGVLPAGRPRFCPNRYKRIKPLS